MVTDPFLHLDWGVNQQPSGLVQQQLFFGEFSQLWSRKPSHEAEGGDKVSGQCQEGPAQMGAVHSSQVCHVKTFVNMVEDTSSMRYMKH